MACDFLHNTDITNSITEIITKTILILYLVLSTVRTFGFLFGVSRMNDM